MILGTNICVKHSFLPQYPIWARAQQHSPEQKFQEARFMYMNTSPVQGNLVERCRTSVENMAIFKTTIIFSQDDHINQWANRMP